jgi:arylsulfatase A-like enzyme
MGKPREKEYFVNEDPKATNFVTNSAIQFMEKETKAGNPFFMQVSYYAVHLAVAAHEETVEKYRKKGTPDRAYTHAWAAMTEELDGGVARLLNAIDKLGIGNNTYVIYTADNGGSDNIPGASSSAPPVNTPLSGAKQSLLEGGIRVPFIVKGPSIKAGSVCHTAVVGYDFLPTFYALAGGKAPLSKEIDGGNIAPLFTNPANGKVIRPNNALFFSRPENGYSAIRQGEYKLMIYWDDKGKVKSRTLHRFNPDPAETGKDISSNNTEKADEMQNALLDYLKSVNAKTAKSGKKPRSEE